MQTSTSTAAPSPALLTSPSGRAGKYLIFHLGSEEFGIEVLKVREIMGLQDITAVPQVPGYVRGVINLRGKVIPVVDLRLKFELPPEPYSARTCIIVVRIEQEGDPLVIGMIVDGVVEVLPLNDAEIEDTPDFGTGVVTPFLKGMAKIKDRVKILLDIDQVLSKSDLHGLGALLS